MKSTYNPNDVILLLKDITGLVPPLPTAEREKLIQNGTHYCEMLPLEYKASEKYQNAYNVSLDSYAKQTADAVCHVSEKIYQSKGNEIVLVSLARAGIPIGILIKHYLERKYQLVIPHYSISIIRGRGIDHNAIKHILSNHKPSSVQFIDGWIGKGAIQTELRYALDAYPSLSAELAVLSDPANITDLCGTHDDILIPSACLNCTVSGLLSRTFLREDLIGENDYHGAAFYSELIKEDLSYDFINKIEEHFDYDTRTLFISKGALGIDEVKKIASQYSIDNTNFIKPGIGEATRVLLRRVPWKLLINEHDETNPLLFHLIQLAHEKNVPIEYYPLKNYKACGIIKQIADA